MDFLNNDLNFDIDKILSHDTPILIEPAEDEFLDYRYGIDVEDTAYWYATRYERDSDFLKLAKLIRSSNKMNFKIKE